jgi:hypothetical protein
MARKNIPAPYGCSWCGDEKHHHGNQWAPIIGMHQWRQPTQDQIKERMLRRLDARLNADPPKYHATTAWAADHTGESADPFCADCKTETCRPWLRVQAKLDRIRWGITYPKRAQPGGWAGVEPF